MKAAIVTGANGFVGSAVVRELLSNGVGVCAVVHQRADHLPKEDRLLRIVSCDLEEPSALGNVIARGGYDTFYSLAWSGVSGPDRGSVPVQMKNVFTAERCVRAAKDLGVRRFIFAGSIMETETVFGLAGKDRMRPGYIYGGAKLAAHTACKCLAAGLDMEYVGLRLTNAYGPGEVSGRLISSTLRRCLRGESSRFTAGTQNYDFVYIDDAARAFRLIGERGQPFHEYLIGSGHARPLKEFLLEMRSAVAPEADFRFGEAPFSGVDLPLECFACTETEADTGFRAKVDFAEGCRRTYDWWKERYEKNV